MASAMDLGTIALLPRGIVRFTGLHRIIGGRILKSPRPRVLHRSTDESDLIPLREAATPAMAHKDISPSQHERDDMDELAGSIAAESEDVGVSMQAFGRARHEHAHGKEEAQLDVIPQHQLGQLDDGNANASATDMEMDIEPLDDTFGDADTPVPSIEADEPGLSSADSVGKSSEDELDSFEEQLDDSATIPDQVESAISESPCEAVTSQDADEESSWEDEMHKLIRDEEEAERDASDLEFFGDADETRAAAYLNSFDTQWIIDESEYDEYVSDRSKIEGIEHWNQELGVLHKTLGLRGLFPLLPTAWADDLIDHPGLSDMFPREGDDRPVLLQAESSQFRATRALRNLFEVHAKANAYRQEGRPDKIAGFLVRELRAYNCWADEDVFRYKRPKRASAVFVVKLDSLIRRDGNRTRTDFQGHVIRVFTRRARRYRRYYREVDVKEYPRMMYAYIVVQHLVMILALDTRDAEAKPILFARLDMSAEHSWVDSSLAVAIPIHFAKRALSAMRDRLPDTGISRDTVDALDDI